MQHCLPTPGRVRSHALTQLLQLPKSPRWRAKKTPWSLLWHHCRHDLCWQCPHPWDALDCHVWSLTRLAPRHGCCPLRSCCCHTVVQLFFLDPWAFRSCLLQQMNPFCSCRTRESFHSPWTTSTDGSTSARSISESEAFSPAQSCSPDPQHRPPYLPVYNPATEPWYWYPQGLSLTGEP